MGRDTDFNFGENALAQELAAAAESYCMGRVKCAHCGKVYGCCTEVEVNLSGGTYMLPRAGAQTPAPQGGAAPRQQSGFPYVRETDLSTDKKRARILDVRVNDAKVKEGQRRYSDVIAKIALEGKTFLFGLKADNPNYELLVREFSEDENRWPDREFFLYLELDSFSGKYWTRVEPITAAEGKKKK